MAADTQIETEGESGDELHTAAIGLAAGIGVLLVAAMGLAVASRHRGSHNTKMMHNFHEPSLSHGDGGDGDGVTSMWDDEQWDANHSETNSPEAVAPGVDVVKAAKVLNANGITPSMMRTMLTMQDRLTSRGASRGDDVETPSQGAGMLVSPISGDDQQIAFTDGGEPYWLKSELEGPPRSKYSLYTGSRAPSTGDQLEDTSENTSPLSIPEANNDGFNRRTSLSFNEVMEGNAALEIMKESGDISNSNSVNATPEVANNTPDNASAIIVEEDPVSTPTELAKAATRIANRMISSATLPSPKTESRMSNRMNTDVSIASFISVPDTQRHVHLTTRQDSAFVSDFGSQSPDGKTQIQNEHQDQALKESAAALRKLEELKQQSDQQVAAMSAKKDLSDRQVQKLMQGKSKADEKIAIILQQKQQKDEEVRALQQNAAISQAELRKLKEVIATFQRQNSDLQNSLGQAHVLLGDAQAENIEIKKIVQESQTILADKNNEISRMKMELEEQKAKLTKNLTMVAGELSAIKEQHTALLSLTQSEYPKLLSSLQDTTTTLVGASETAIVDATRDLLARYKHECRERKLLYNHIQELRGNIRVFCRVRNDPRAACVLRFPDKSALGTPTELMCPNPADPTLSKRFEFDRVFNPEDDQEAVFDDTEPVITSVVDGYNVSIIAYGQTGSGKTYTMMGTEDNPGVNRRAVRELLRVCNERQNATYEISVSLLEIYNDSIIDLLSTVSVEDQTCALRMDPATGNGFVTDLTWRGISTIEDVVSALVDGEKNRSVACTKMNSASSRSHLVLTLEVKGYDKVSEQHTVGKLRMVDLAGSERNSKSGATGKQLVEANAINKSLSALGQCFISLQQGANHVPFRNSKLTHLLQDSLGGQSKTCFFVNISPAESNLQETISTLQFGMNIRKVLLKKDSNEGSSRRRSTIAEVDSNGRRKSTTGNDSPSTRRRSTAGGDDNSSRRKSTNPRRHSIEPVTADVEGFIDGAMFDPGSPRLMGSPTPKSRPRRGSDPTGGRANRRSTMDPGIMRQTVPE